MATTLIRRSMVVVAFLTGIAMAFVAVCFVFVWTLHSTSQLRNTMFESASNWMSQSPADQEKPSETAAATSAARTSDQLRLDGVMAANRNNDTGVNDINPTDRVTRRDIEILQRDLQRARAAYPDLGLSELTVSRWFVFSEIDRIPAKDYPNSQAACTASGACWVKAAYINVVRPEFKSRADDAATDLYLAKLDLKRTTALANRNRIFWANAGADGYFSVDCAKPTGCLVKYAEPQSPDGSQYAFPFVMSEWNDAEYHTIDDIRKMPAFTAATATKIKVAVIGQVVPPAPNGPPVTPNTVRMGSLTAEDLAAHAPNPKPAPKKRKMP